MGVLDFGNEGFGDCRGGGFTVIEFCHEEGGFVGAEIKVSFGGGDGEGV